MSERSDGGPAFPQPINFDGERRDFPCEFGLGGISLRDYFAAQIMPTVMDVWERNSGDEAWEHGFEMMASVAYDAADALLAQKEQ